MADYVGGILFKEQDKRSDRAPDWTGELELDKETLKFIGDEVRAGRTPKFRLAAWEKEGRRGTFLSLKASVPQKREDRDDRRDERRDDRRDDRRSPPPRRQQDLGDDIPF